MCGFGLLGKLVAKRLQKEGIEFVIIDKNNTMALHAQTLGYHALCADATQSVVFQRLGIKRHINHVMALTSDDEQNAFIGVNVKSLNKQVTITARCSDKHIADKLRFAGVDKVIIPEEVAGMMGAVYAGESAALEIALLFIEEKRHIKIDEITVLPDSKLGNKTIKEINFDALRLILLGIFRYNNAQEDFIFNPPNDFLLLSGDIIVCMGYERAFTKLQQKVQHEY